MTHYEDRALTEAQVETIQRNILGGLYDDHDIHRLFQTIRIQKEVLRELFQLWRAEPLKLIALADPVRRSHLTHLVERVAMEGEPWKW